MAAALTRAKKQDTSRKNSLIRLLDSIPQLLEDLGVSPERLVEARKTCRSAWEQFALAHDALIEVRTEEEDPDEQEYGTLESRMQELSGALAEAIAVRTRARDALKLHQEKEAEEEQFDKKSRMSWIDKIKSSLTWSCHAVYNLPTFMSSVTSS